MSWYIFYYSAVVEELNIVPDGESGELDRIIGCSDDILPIKSCLLLSLLADFTLISLRSFSESCKVTSK